MGYVFVTGNCVTCKRLFSFHPNKVPSLTVNGTREPVCKQCIEEANELRAGRGMDPLTYHPAAYEPAREEEVNWG